jgi:hypothetical protein
MWEMGPVSNERRKHTRFPFRGEVEVRSLAKPQRDGGRVLDVSVNGIGFSTPLELRVGDQVRLSFGNIDGELAIEAVVRHVASSDGLFHVGAMA